MGQGEIFAVGGCEDELGQEAGVGGVAVEETGAEGEACWGEFEEKGISARFMDFFFIKFLCCCFLGVWNMTYFSPTPARH